MACGGNGIIEDSLVLRNEVGIDVCGSNNTIEGNTVQDNVYTGIHLGDDYTVVLHNNIIDNASGVYVGSYNNTIYNNRFTGNQTHAQNGVYDGSSNVFNLGMPIGGNYWDDWTGPDNDGDGFVDVPYDNGNGVHDDYPWADKDSDGILDDGDRSGIIGDAPCAGGNTTDCDDNCINTPNPDQADADNDGAGDACDCDDNDPNNWISCSTCADSDSDNFFANCDAYITIGDPDCDDTDPLINQNTIWYPDADGDGYGNPSVAYPQCSMPAGSPENFILNNTDPDDSDPNIYPGASYVRIDVTYYLNLQDTYDGALEGDIIQSQTRSFTEDVYIDSNKTVTLQGGYNSGYTSVTGKTTINGNMTISDGTITIGDLIIQ